MIQKVLQCFCLLHLVVGKKISRNHENYNPDQHLTPLEMAVRHGYPTEAHVVQTSDGYLLTMHRIPCGRAGCRNGRGRGQPVLLKHGFLSSSADWLVIGPEKGLGYLLADAGYDVWMGNSRGNTYSRKHVRLRTKDPEFWDFTPHDMALYDVPAEIDYIYSYKFQESNRTEKDLLYVGFSMGATMFYAYLSTYPEHNDKVKAMFGMAPAVYWTHVRSPLRYLGSFSKHPEIMANLLGYGELAPQNWLTRSLALQLCGVEKVYEGACLNLNFILFGYNREQVNETLLPVILSHVPAGTSSKTITHVAQEVEAEGQFQTFDYGREENERRYSHSVPQVYNLDNINVPIMVFYGDNDWIAGPEDIKLFYHRMKRRGKSIKMHRVHLESFNHVDFVWAIDVKELVYDYLMDAMLAYPAETRPAEPKIPE